MVALWSQSKWVILLYFDGNSCFYVILGFYITTILTAIGLIVAINKLQMYNIYNILVYNIFIKFLKCTNVRNAR